MENFEALYSKSVRRFAKSLVLITVLFAVFACGFAAVVLHFNKSTEINSWFIALIYILSIFPLIVFLSFPYLMARHYNSLSLFLVAKYKDKVTINEIQVPQKV